MAAMIPKVIIDLGKAIAHAEGFGVPDAVPTRAHNPGDLKIPGWTGPTTGNEGISVFSDDEVGWGHLYNQLIRIMTGSSHVYKLTMTLTEFAAKWTDTQQTSWLDNVIFELQNLGYAVDSNTTLEEYFTVEE